jgi:hypothetical protein
MSLFIDFLSGMGRVLVFFYEQGAAKERIIRGGPAARLAYVFNGVKHLPARMAGCRDLCPAEFAYIGG